MPWIHRELHGIYECLWIWLQNSVCTILSWHLPSIQISKKFLILYPAHMEEYCRTKEEINHAE